MSIRSIVVCQHFKDVMVGQELSKQLDWLCENNYQVVSVHESNDKYGRQSFIIIYNDSKNQEELE